jgi:hypothetical protein
MPAPRIKRIGRRLRRTTRQWIAFTLLLCFAPFILNTDISREDRLLDYALLGEQEKVALKISDLLNREEHSPDHRVAIPATKGAPIRKVSTAPDASIPYYLTGRTAKKTPTDEEYDGQEIFRSIRDSSIEPIPPSQNSWVLPRRLQKTTRNHDNVLFEVEPSGRQILLVLLGRHSGSIQWIDLLTGKENITMVTGKDPAGNDLNDLNHVYSVVVDSLTTPSYKEIWLPCGFHGNEVNKERSSEYARIVNLKTMQVEAGPKLPVAGGACVAAPIRVKGPDHPEHICVFGGTQGSHDTGAFLPYTACYDRVAQKWHHPFGRMPFGFDHGNVVHLPSGVCDPSDPERILVFNFRTESYGQQRPEIMAFDIPSSPWSDEALNSLDAETPGKWYTYANISHSGRKDEVNAPRDASGLAIANNWRNILNFGGIHYFNHRYIKLANGNEKLKKDHRKYSTVRSLDVCTRTWSKVGDMGVRTFALQTSVSAKLNVAITCGGQSFAFMDQNNPWCLASRVPGMQFQTNRGCNVTDDQIPGTVISD